jgi:hypothetical protein
LASTLIAMKPQQLLLLLLLRQRQLLRLRHASARHRRPQRRM